MKQVAERERERAEGRKELQRVTTEELERKKKHATELFDNLNTYVHVNAVVAIVGKLDETVTVARGAEQLKITPVPAAKGLWQYKTETGDFGYSTPTDPIDEDKMLDAFLDFLGK